MKVEIMKKYKPRDQMSEKEIDNLGPMIDENGKWMYDENLILIMEDGLPYYTVEERDRRNAGKPKFTDDEPMVFNMDGKTPDPEMSKEQINNLVKAFIKSAGMDNEKEEYDEDGILKMKKDPFEK